MTRFGPRRGRRTATLLVACTLIVTACTTPAEDAAPPAAPSTTAPERSVTLTRSSVEWETQTYELTRFNTILAGSHDPTTVVTHEFETWVLENEFLRVTLLPGFGGRILSMVYLPTGHEQLYRNPLGVPYQIDTGVFFFDWLMVYGGIFPTFPGPEHGKTWFLPWEFEVVEEAGDSVTVAMSFVDDTAYPLAPRQYDGSATGLKVTWLITLEAGRAALDTTITIENPGSEVVSFEYWTNATFAPGSDPDSPAATTGAEIIAPVRFMKIPSYWTAIAAQEERTGINDVHEFEALRHFADWSDMGIAYAWPDMRDSTFWGVVNHDNEEGIFRIADNTITPGLKLWTWGFDRSQRNDPPEARPYIEMWGGLSREFFTPTTINPGETITFPETYTPTAGLAGATHADARHMVNTTIGDGTLTVQLFGLEPGTEATVALVTDGVVADTVETRLDPLGSTITLDVGDTSAEELILIVESQAGTSEFEVHPHP